MQRGISLQRVVERAKITALAEQSTAFVNGLWNAFGNVVNLSTGIMGSLIVVRTLSTTDYGTLSYYLWLSSVLGVFGLLAFPQGHTKIASELRGNQDAVGADRLSSWATGMVFLINFSIVCVVLLYAIVGASSTDRSFLLIVAGVLIPSALSTMLGSRLLTLGRYSWNSMGVQISSIIQLSLLVWGFIHHWKADEYAFALLSPSLFQLAFLAVGNKESILIYKNAFRPPPAKILKKYVHFLIPMTMVVLYERIIWDRSEILFIKIFSSESQIGYYNLAYTTFAMFLNLGLALINGYWPAISKDYGAGNLVDIRGKVQRGVILSFLYAVPFAFGGWVTLHGMMSVMYGTKMAPAALIARILIIGLIPGVVNGMFSLTLSACGYVWTNVKVGLFTSVVSLGLGSVLIAHFGAVGGAISCTLAQLINCLILMFVLQFKIHIQLPWRQLGGIFCVGACTTFAIPTIISIHYSGIIGLVLSIVISAMGYGICILKFGFIKAVRE